MKTMVTAPINVKISNVLFPPPPATRMGLTWR